MEKKIKIPVLSIQCDWNTILSDVGAEAWISCKYKDEPSVHGKLRTVTCLPNPPSVAISDGFIVDNISSTSLTVSLKDASHTTVFVAPEKMYKTIHKGSIQSLDINDTGLAVSCTINDSLITWDTHLQELKLRLNGHKGDVYRCRFFPSGKVILSCGSDMSLRIWCAVTGVCPVILRGHTMAVTDFDMIDRGKNIISCSKDGTLKLWNCGDAACIGTIASVGSSINSCHVSTSPNSLDLGHPEVSSDARETGTKDKMVLYGCEDGQTGIIALNSRKTLFSQTLSSAVNTVAWISPYQFLFGLQDGRVLLYMTSHPEQPKTIWQESNSPILSLLPYNDVGFFLSRMDGSVVFIPTMDPPRSTKRVSFTGSNCDPIYDLKIDGKFIFTCCRDGIARKYLIENVIKTVF